METSYTILRIFAGSWGAVFLATAFLGVILFTLRSGSRDIHKETATIPFRNDDRPKPEDGDAKISTKVTR